MKAVLISIHPKYCKLIADGKKTIEVRKSVPKLERPFKVYIYCTKKPVSVIISGTGRHIGEKDITYCYDERNGRVIGEFVCRGMMGGTAYLLPKQSCLTINEILDYAKGKQVYGWRIADLKIYDKPKGLSEFYSIPKSGSDCCIGCIYHETPIEEMPCKICTGERKYLYRPPQSWCYVEELEL